MAAPAALLDECMDLDLIDALTARGYDVTSGFLPPGYEEEEVREALGRS